MTRARLDDLAAATAAARRGRRGTRAISVPRSLRTGTARARAARPVRVADGVAPRPLRPARRRGAGGGDASGASALGRRPARAAAAPHGDLPDVAHRRLVRSAPARAASLQWRAVRRYHVTTFGCQMNAHDSERIKGMLEELGLGEAASPGGRGRDRLQHVHDPREARPAVRRAPRAGARRCKRARPGAA